MNLFIDMDGVLFDFTTHYQNTVGEGLVEKKDPKQDDMWKRIGKVQNFFATMPLLPGAADFVARYAHLNPIFLTHVPVNKFAPFFEEYTKQKIQAIQQVGWNGLVVPVPGYGKKIEKAAYMQKPGDILVDDWHKNVAAWIDAGGQGILHTDFTTTIAEMEWILYRLSHPDVSVS